MGLDTEEVNGNRRYLGQVVREATQDRCLAVPPRAQQRGDPVLGDPLRQISEQIITTVNVLRRQRALILERLNLQNVASAGRL